MNLKTLALTLAAAVGIAATATAQSTQAKILPVSSSTSIRFIHAVPGAIAMNCRLNRYAVFKNVPYGSSQPARRVRTGSYLLDLTTPYGVTNFVAPDPLDLLGGVDTTVVAVGSVGGSPPLETTLVDIPRYRVPKHEAHLVFLHAVADAPPVDVLVDGAVVSPALPYKGYDPPHPVTRGVHTIEVQLGGNTILGPTTMRLDGSRKHTFVVMGTADPNDGYPLILRRFVSE